MDVINYICANLKRQDRVLWNIGKALRRQKSFNSGVVTMIYAVGAYAYLTNLRLREQEYRIEQLEAELKEGAAK